MVPGCHPIPCPIFCTSGLLLPLHSRNRLVLLRTSDTRSAELLFPYRPAADDYIVSFNSPGILRELMPFRFSCEAADAGSCCAQCGCACPFHIPKGCVPHRETPLRK